ncbi:MAG: zf-HC2 domain-containing protein [Acidobacteriota bacterium]
MRECRRTKPNLVAFLYGELDEPEREKVRLHLETCPACRRELDALGKTVRSADALSPEIEKALAGVDWEAQAEKIVAAVWKEEERPLGAPQPERFRFLVPGLRPALAGLLLGIVIGAVAMFIVFGGGLLRKAEGGRLFASREFLDRVDLEIARRETLSYLEKSQYVLLELAQPPAESGPFKLSEGAARETRQLLSKKKFLNAQLEKARMAKAKEICDQIELLFYELTRVGEDLTTAQREEIQSLIEEKNLLLKIKLLRKELQKSEV